MAKRGKQAGLAHNTAHPPPFAYRLLQHLVIYVAQVAPWLEMGLLAMGLVGG